MIILFSLGGCNEINMECNWTDSPIEVDGIRSDWSNIPFHYFEEDKISIGICNDDDYLYLLMLTRDMSLNRNINRGGLKLWLDLEAGKDKNNGLLIVGTKEMSEDPRMKRENLRDLSAEEREEQIREMAAKPKNVIILNGKQRADITNNNSININFASGYDAGFIFYEYRIPLRNSPLFVDNSSIKNDINFSIGLEVSGLDNKAMKEKRQQMADQGSGFGGRGGGNRGGGKSGGMRQQMQQNNRPREIWLKTKLAIASD